MSEKTNVIQLEKEMISFDRKGRVIISDKSVVKKIKDLTKLNEGLIFGTANAADSNSGCTNIYCPPK